MKKIDFTKAVASGNDFIIIDRIRSKRPESSDRSEVLRKAEEKSRAIAREKQIAELAKRFCQRKKSIGADGLLLLEPSKVADFKMRIFNPDGTEVDMCGNGSRCVALYARQGKVILGSKMVIETRAGNLQAEVKQDKVRVRISRPKDLKVNLDLDISGKMQKVNYINTGVPHVVCFVPGLAGFDVREVGRAIRYHPDFQPEGTNADFVEVVDKRHIRIRTYERGVEQETLSCGTGCVAAAIITTYEMQQNPQGAYKIKVDTQDGEVLAVYFNIKKAIIDKTFLEGKAKIVYKGKAIV